MITKQLKKGDHIFSPTYGGTLAVILRVNKQTYTTNFGTIPFHGVQKAGPWQDDVREWFDCDDARGKALEIMYGRLEKRERACAQIEAESREIRELLGKAKAFLSEIKDIDTVPVTELDDSDYDSSDCDGDVRTVVIR